MANVFLDVYRNGSYFHPAYRHYGNIEIDVGCDRCQRLGLMSCIGWQDKDLCMQCVAELDEYYDDGYFNINAWDTPGYTEYMSDDSYDGYRSE